MTRVEFSRYLVCKTQYPEDGDLDQLTIVNLITLKNAKKAYGVHVRYFQSRFSQMITSSVALFDRCYL